MSVKNFDQLSLNNLKLTVRGTLLIIAQNNHTCIKNLENVQYFPIKEVDMIVNTMT